MITTNIGFHGVARMEVGKASTHTIGDRTWQARTIWLYDKHGDEAVSFQLHSAENGSVSVDIEPQEEVSLSDLDKALATFP